jgi:Domain of unknown function (DUF6379)
MMVDKIIEDGTLRTHADGFSVNARLPWYRSLPLSTVDVSDLKLDGHSVDRDRIEFIVNGQVHKLSELKDFEQEFWFILDSAEIRVKGSPLAANSEHDVELELALRPPYIKGLQRLLRWTKRMQVK